MDSKITIGGQALIEGVMMRSNEKYAICIRRPDKTISTKIIKIKPLKFAKIPIIRGIFRFAETLMIGIESISYSALESQGEEDQLSSWDLILTIIFSIGLTILLFYMAPLLLTNIITDSASKYYNLIDGLFRLGIFLLYLLGISLLPDIKRIFQYHGAEHMTVACYEDKKPLTPKNVKKYSPLHPRCGTSFILIVFVLSIFFFTFIKVDGYFPRLGIRILLLPLIAGVSYEILKFAGKYHNNFLVKIIVFPGLLLQKITTKKPNTSMIEVAIQSLKALL